jgi:hypothetical protein
VNQIIKNVNARNGRLMKLISHILLFLHHSHRVIVRIRVKEFHLKIGRKFHLIGKRFHQIGV